MTKEIPNLLFEIGTEEIPSDYLSFAVESIQRKLPKLLETCGYSSEEIKIEATPRRFVVFAKKVAKKAGVAEERFGPWKEQSYQNGEPTAALTGFLKSAGKKESDLIWKDMPKGARAVLLIPKEVKPLKFLFETLPSEIEFPKLMQWDKTHYKFTRPIRWSFAILGKKFQNYQIGTLKSGNYSYGHRFLANHKIYPKSADLELYEKMLLKNHVVLSHEKRARKIREFLKNTRNTDQELIQKVANLVEEPFAVKGTFKKEYLSLPSDVLSTSMRHHQKIFACYDPNGKLTNQFIAVVNGKRSAVRVIAKNYENVLVSRLEDAKFFFNEDTKTKLEAKVPKLKEMIFLGKLGSYYDKVERLQKLAEHLGKGTAHVKDAVRAAYLSKADLMTRLVYEFPELQGVAGSEYAKRDGENETVAAAIRDHYYPLNLTESYKELPNRLNRTAVLVSLADRIDLLVGAIGIGIEPSGSKDPYALRRAMGGIVKLVRAFQMSLPFESIIQKSIDLYGKSLKVNSAEIQAKLVPFLEERMAFELNLKPGTKPYEIFKAVFASNSTDIANVYKRFDELNHLYEKSHDEFLRACKIIERTSNILKGVKVNIQSKVDPDLFQAEEERALYQILQEKESSISELLSNQKYALASGEYSKSFYEAVHNFFDKVMVNDQNEQIRSNRRALVQKVNQLYTEKIANLALITNQ